MDNEVVVMNLVISIRITQDIYELINVEFLLITFAEVLSKMFSCFLTRNCCCIPEVSSITLLDSSVLFNVYNMSLTFTVYKTTNYNVNVTVKPCSHMSPLTGEGHCRGIFKVKIPKDHYMRNYQNWSSPTLI